MVCGRGDCVVGDDVGIGASVPRTGELVGLLVLLKVGDVVGNEVDALSGDVVGTLGLPTLGDCVDGEIVGFAGEDVDELGAIVVATVVCAYVGVSVPIGGNVLLGLISLGSLQQYQHTDSITSP